MNLRNLREKLDEVDEKILRLLAERQAYMPEIGKYKREQDIQIDQPEREKEILEKKIKLARKLGLDEGLTEEIFLALFRNAKEIQRKMNAQE